MFAAGDAGWMTAWATTQAKTSGTGLLSNGSDATRYVVLVTPGTGALADDAILEWGDENAILDEDSDLLYHTMGLRGKYVVFMRNNVQTGAGSDIQVYLRFIFDNETDATGIAGIGNRVDLPYVNPKTVTTTRNSEKSYALTYMGTIDIPPAVAAGSHITGLGLDNVSRMRIQLRNAARAAASAMTFRVLDLVFMKYDEAFAMLEVQSDQFTDFTPTDSNHHYIIYDNTGYFSHGKRDAVAVAQRGTSDLRGIPFLERRGQEIFLEPNMRNRLYFLNDEYVRLSASTSEVISDYQTAATTANNRDMNVHVHIVPRWVGAADI
jgi:hypothetical protein